MNLKNTILDLLRIIGINVLLLLVAAIFDLLLSAFTFPGFTIACFTVAGVFSGVFCFSAATEHTTKEERKGKVMCHLIWIIIMCTSLFLVIAPLSTQEYNSPVKFFAVAEIVIALFLWKNKFYNNVGTSGPDKNNY
ncbi:MAG: hypothetical protein JSS98_17345 [Bacteroidetes bacterium]|nr:hypothetical protein [Bacteroidota bacterium]